MSMPNLLTNGTGVSEITALNSHEFIVDERDGKGLGEGTSAAVKMLYKIDLAGAIDITGMSAATAKNFAVPKSSFADLISILTAAGLTPAQIPSKIEGLAFGDDVSVNVGGALTTEHALWVANDNDFVPGSAGPNTFYVLGVSNADLAGSALVPQFVPEPPLIGLFGFAALTMAGARTARRGRGALLRSRG